MAATTRSMPLARAIAPHVPETQVHTPTRTRAYTHMQSRTRGCSSGSSTTTRGNTAADSPHALLQLDSHNTTHPTRTSTCLRQLLQGCTSVVLHLRVMLMTFHCGHDVFDALCLCDCRAVLCDQGHARTHTDAYTNAHTGTHPRVTRQLGVPMMMAAPRCRQPPHQGCQWPRSTAWYNHTPATLRDPGGLPLLPPLALCPWPPRPSS